MSGKEVFESFHSFEKEKYNFLILRNVFFTTKTEFLHTIEMSLCLPDVNIIFG